MMDLSVLMPWIIAAMTIANFLTLIRNALSSGEKKIQERLSKAESTLIKHDRRIQSIEGDIQHLPDRDSSHRLELTMEKISGRLDTLDERLKPIAATSGRLQEFLLEQAQK